jgi:hypothetical protein
MIFSEQVLSVASRRIFMPMSSWIGLRVGWRLLKECNIPDIKSMQKKNKMLEMADKQQYNHNNTTIILK